MTECFALGQNSKIMKTSFKIMFQNSTKSLSQQPYFVVLMLILAAACSRMIPHPPNWTAVVAMSLFAGAMLPSLFLSLVVPVISLLLTDLVFGFHSTMWGVYLPMMAIVLLGRWALTQKRNVVRVMGLGLVSSIAFFVISNMAVWLVGGLYPLTLTGLVECYTMAVPFFSYQLGGDLMFTAVIFGAYALLARGSSHSPAATR